MTLKGGTHEIPAAWTAGWSGNSGIVSSPGNGSTGAAFDVRIFLWSSPMTHFDPTSQDSSSGRPDGDRSRAEGTSHRDAGVGDDLRFDPLTGLPSDLNDVADAAAWGELDRALSDLLSPVGRGDVDAAMVDRILAATRSDLPARVLSFEAPDAGEDDLRVRPGRGRTGIPARLVAGFGAVAAAVAVAVFAARMLPTPAQDLTAPSGSGERLADLADASAADLASDPLEAIRLLPTRESEVMLVAVLDPAEDWFDDDAPIELDAESVLRSRAFGLDELEGSVYAMLGGPTS